MEKRDPDPHLINYNDSIDWKEAFKLHPSPLTPGKSLRKVMTIQMDIPNIKYMDIVGGINETWLFFLSGDYGLNDGFYYVSRKGEVKFICKKCLFKFGTEKYIFENEFGDIFLIDTDNDNIVDTGLNKIRDRIDTIITDYGEFAYVRNDILIIPDRNLTIKIKNDIASIGLNHYTSRVYDSDEKIIFTSYNLNNDTDVFPDTFVYKDKLIANQVSITGINDQFYYIKEDNDILERVYSIHNNLLIGTLDITNMLNKVSNNWYSEQINFEYTQVIVKKKGSENTFEVYQH